MQCAPKYNEANREQYRPENPHPTSLRTSKDYPEEMQKLALQAEKLRKKKEREAAKKCPAEEDAESSPPVKRTKRTPKNAHSPPPALSEEELHDAFVEFEDSLSKDAEADVDDESEQAPIVPPPKLKLKKKPAQKNLVIKDPPLAAALNPVIDMTNLVIAKPLASKPPV